MHVSSTSSRSAIFVLLKYKVCCSVCCWVPMHIIRESSCAESMYYILYLNATYSQHLCMLSAISKRCQVLCTLQLAYGAMCARVVPVCCGPATILHIQSCFKEKRKVRKKRNKACAMFLHMLPFNTLCKLLLAYNFVWGAIYERRYTP